MGDTFYGSDGVLKNYDISVPSKQILVLKKEVRNSFLYTSKSVQFLNIEVYKTAIFAKAKHLGVFKTTVFLETTIFLKYFRFFLLGYQKIWKPQNS